MKTLQREDPSIGYLQEKRKEIKMREGKEKKKEKKTQTSFPRPSKIPEGREERLLKEMAIGLKK